MFTIFLRLSKLQSVGGMEKRTNSNARGQEAERCWQCQNRSKRSRRAESTEVKSEPQRRSAQAALWTDKMLWTAKYVENLDCRHIKWDHPELPSFEYSGINLLVSQMGIIVLSFVKVMLCMQNNVCELLRYHSDVYTTKIPQRKSIILNSVYSWNGVLYIRYGWCTEWWN